MCKETPLNKHKLIIFYVTKSMAEGRTAYDAARFAWKFNDGAEKANKACFVLAARHGKIVGVFEPTAWLPMNNRITPDRWQFVGMAAPVDIENLYLGTQLPDSMRSYGNPYLYNYK